MLQNTEHTSVVTVTAPASKSLSHRYLIGAALAGGASTVRHTLESADLECTRAILAGAGARLEPLEASGDGANSGSGGWRVHGLGGAPRGGHGCLRSGTRQQGRALACRLGS